MKLKLKKILLLVSLISLLPSALYFLIFNTNTPRKYIISISNISTKNSDWGDFGSYIGGMYSAFFAFASLCAVLYSLYLSQQNYSEQTKLLKSEQTSKEFHLILDKIKEKFTSKIYKNLNNVRVEKVDFYKEINGLLSNELIFINLNSLNDKKKELIKHGYVLLRFGVKTSFTDEIKLLIYLLEIIERAPIQLSNAFKIIFETTIDNSDRFYLEIIARSESPRASKILDQWEGFSELPEKIDKVINPIALLQNPNDIKPNDI